MVASGNTYERAAMVEHLQRSQDGRDPITNVALAKWFAFPNWHVRRQVQEFLDAHPQYTPDGWSDRRVPNASQAGDLRSNGVKDILRPARVRPALETCRRLLEHEDAAAE